MESVLLHASHVRLGNAILPHPFVLQNLNKSGQSKGDQDTIPKSVLTQANCLSQHSC